MKQSNPHRACTKNKRLPDMNAHWIVAFIMLTILSVVLFFVVKPWVLKILLLLITIGMAFKCLLLFESRRIILTQAQKDSQPVPSFGKLVVETESETFETMEVECVAEESPQPSE